MTTYQPQIYSLAAQNLDHGKIKLANRLKPEAINSAIAACGSGLDHSIGEQVLAIGDDSYRDPLDHFFILTDRRLAGRIIFRSSRKFYDLALLDLALINFDFSNSKESVKQFDDAAVIEQACRDLHKSSDEIAGFLDGLSCVLLLPETAIKTSMKSVLKNFLHRMKQVPLQDLLPSEHQLLYTTPDDSSGAGYALQFARTPQAVTALRLALEQYGRGQITEEAAKDFVTRSSLLDRTCLFGRGKNGGWWLTPLSSNDLVYAFSVLFGQPVYSQQNEGVWALDFRIDEKKTGKALGSSAAGLAVGALLGFGWITLPGASIDSLRLSFIDTAPLTRFALHALYKNQYVPLHHVRYQLLALIAQNLQEYESSLTVLRSAFGWNEPPYQLAGSPPSRLEFRLKELGL